jgi:hypothetical protein
MSVYFNLVWILIIFFVALYNYIYIGVVLPELEKIRGSSQIELLPTKQVGDIDEYVRLQAQKDNKPWQYYPARYWRSVATVLASLSMFGLLIAELGPGG